MDRGRLDSPSRRVQRLWPWAAGALAGLVAVLVWVLSANLGREGTRSGEATPPEPGTASPPPAVVLALDISGSMAAQNKMDEAKQFAHALLNRLPEAADCGLILFDHDLREKVPLANDPERRDTHRDLLHQRVMAARPLGGTAYLDATAEAVLMLRGAKGPKTVVVMTDGVDIGSKNTLDEVIRMAHDVEVSVYTLGIGEPGRNERVTTVLVLDRSASMLAVADAKDKLRKIDALRRAANRFVDLMGPTAETTLLPFADKPEKAGPFQTKKDILKARINALEARGGTALFDAVYDAVQTILAAQPDGKRAVVALTDGIDTSSQRRPEEVIEHAKAAQIPLFMLGLGRSNQFNEQVLEQMAQQTGGKYYHAQNQQKLSEFFESLSIQFHDDGIDEEALKRLAQETGGKYYPAREPTRLRMICDELTKDLPFPPR